MRLWTLHPQYLDARGLVALWREALLAQAVLAGRTRGYVAHPQLLRFRRCSSPLPSIAFYLRVIHVEAAKRGYRFEEARIVAAGDVERIVVTRGQLEYEWALLQGKLQGRAPAWRARLRRISDVEPHPLFEIVLGPVEPWEVVRSSRA